MLSGRPRVRSLDLAPYHYSFLSLYLYTNPRPTGFLQRPYSPLDYVALFPS